MNPLLFTDPAFLFCFAPVVLTLHYVWPKGWRNGFLLASSLLLYAWGEGTNVAVLLACVAISYGCGLWIGRHLASSRRTLVLGVAANLLLLAVFKYSAFVVTNVDVILGSLGFPLLPVPKIRLPVGMSFFTFMAISYLVDVYRQDVEEERNPATFGLYLALFPHLIAGPIVRFQDIAAQLHRRSISMPEVAQGIRRFVIGLGKKVLVGDTVAATADRVFGFRCSDYHPINSPRPWRGSV
jgi:alginate O-acetyltransferase complex protein AlgI